MPKILKPTDPLTVSRLPLCIIGPSGSWKTTLAQTAASPITIDADEGIHRVKNRRDTLTGVDTLTGEPRPLTWQDVVEATNDGSFGGYDTIVVDTLGRLLSKIMPFVQRLSAKNCGAGGMGLSPAGYGVLGQTFIGWANTIRAMNKDLVMLAHQKEGERDQIRPDLPGKMAWSDIHTWCDSIGVIKFSGRDRILDFNPAEGYECAKNALGLAPIPLPNLHKETDFLARLIAGGKRHLSQLSDEVQTHVKAVALWKERMEADLTRPELNELVTEYITLPKPLKLDVWPMLEAKGKAGGWTLDKATKQFVIPEPKGEAA